ncbi:hypothetical protein QBC37DRAFT_300910, partial [Rhypophila decipiens]
CQICSNTKPQTLFPTSKLTDSCNEHPLPCLSCVAGAIAADFTGRIFSPTQIRCPVCTTALAYPAVLKYATGEIRERYERLTLVKALQDDQKFVLCQCGTGQIHETGAAQPIVTCLQCRGKSCFVHRTAWHENLTCAEYDALQKDPVRWERKDTWEIGVTDEVPRERGALEKMRADAWKKKEEESASTVTIAQTTKQCPGCKYRIEKNRGW